MSSLRKRGRRWYLCYTLTETRDGQRVSVRKQIPLISPGQKMATTSRGVAGNLQKEFDGEFKSKPPAKLDNLLGQFERSNALAGSAQQARRNRAIVKRLIDHYSLESIYALDAQLIRRWLDHLSDQGCERATLANHRSAISIFCESMIDFNVFTENPTSRIRLGKVPVKPPRHLNQQEIAVMLDVARKNGIYDLIWLALNTAMRLDEIRTLEWTDFYWDQKLIILDETKSKRPRVIPMSDGLFDYFYLRRLTRGPVFPGRQYDGCSGFAEKHTLIARLKPIRDAIGKFTQGMKHKETGRAFHLIRHTAATWLAMNGVELVKIQHLLGHKSIKTTERYSYFQPSRWDSYINRLLPAALDQNQNPDDRRNQSDDAGDNQRGDGTDRPLAQTIAKRIKVTA